MARIARPTPLDSYLFDLRGYLILERALGAGEVRACNAILDAIPQLEPGQWYGAVHGHQYGTTDGRNYQQIYEAGEPFERLIDHPAWIELVKHFVGGEGTFDYHHGPLFIDEAFASFRGPGEAIGLHSGGHSGTKRNQYRFHNGSFQCGQVNVLVALTDIGPGDGGTMIVPGSHKANFEHPQFEQFRMGVDRSVEGVEGAVDVHLEAGDALLFVDALSHGSAKRTTAGERRVSIYRYGPSWGFFRHGYRPTRELINRLTPERRQIVMPHLVIERDPDQVVD